MSADREAFEKHFPAAAANWLSRSEQYSGPYDLLWKGWCAALESTRPPDKAEPVTEGLESNDPDGDRDLGELGEER